MKIARNVAVSERYVEWYSPFPAPSLRELARPKGVTEGVSSDGCSMPMVYKPAHIDSEIFERLRSSGYTPSVSHSLDSSLREGAGNGGCHSSGCSLMSGVTGDFHRPYETLKTLHCTIQRRTLPQSALAGCQLPQRGSREWLTPFIRVLANVRGYGRFSSPLRRAGAIHPGARKIRGYGRFSSPLRNSEDLTLYHSTDCH